MTTQTSRTPVSLPPTEPFTLSLICGLAFFIPISTSVTGGLMLLILLSWCLGGQLKAKLAYYWAHPLAMVILSIFAVSLLSISYSVASWSEIVSRLKALMRFAYIPILSYYLQPNYAPRWVAMAFVSAMSLTLVLGMAKLGLDWPIGLKYSDAAVFKSYIKTNFFMSIAAFMVLYASYQWPRYRKGLVLLLALMVYYILFMSAGRVGYGVLAILAIYSSYCWSKWRGLGIGVLVILGIMLGAYYGSPTFAARIKAMSYDWVLYEQGHIFESSLGSRWHFYIGSLKLMAQAPWFGWGIASFKAAYAPLVSQGFLATDNPHNEYLRWAVELGIVGLLLLGYLFYQQYRALKMTCTAQEFLGKGILLAFMVGCMANSWLSDFTESYFYILATSSLLASVTILKPKIWVKATLH